MLISLSGSFAGMVANTGLTNTSPKPDETEKTIVPRRSPIYTFSKITGARANKINPRVQIKGIVLTVFAILNLCEKKENIRSMDNCVI